MQRLKMFNCLHMYSTIRFLCACNPADFIWSSLSDSMLAKHEFVAYTEKYGTNLNLCAENWRGMPHENQHQFFFSVQWYKNRVWLPFVVRIAAVAQQIILRYALYLCTLKDRPRSQRFGAEIHNRFFSSNRADILWGSPNLILIGFRVFFRQ